MKTTQTPPIPRTGIFLIAIMAACWTLLLAGCQSARQDRFIVQASALDNLQIVRVHVSHTTGQAETLRIDLAGSGYLELTAGRSERVHTGFWQENTSPEWSDWRRDAIVLSPASTIAYFQAFVTAGVFDRAAGHKPQQESDLAIRIAIRNRKTRTRTADPVYHQLFTQLLGEF